MFKRKKLYAAILLAVFAVSCRGSANGLLIVANAADDSITIKREIASQGEITPGGENVITKAMLEGNTALLEFVDTAQCFEIFNATNKKLLIDDAEKAINILQNLETKGVLHIKSDSAKERFASVIRKARLAIFAIKVAVQLLPASADGAPALVLTEKQKQQLADFRATCREASDILHRSKDKLEEDLRRLETAPDLGSIGENVFG